MGKVVVITCGSRGISAATTHLSAELGCIDVTGGK